MGTVATVASSWLDRIEASRQGLIEAAKTGNRVMAAFAQADARAELIASLKDEQIQARLLKITDPDLAMVELANNPTKEDRVRICAIAILSGFVPGDDQFAIFGGGKDRNGHSKPGKLYTKEAGYRTLFGHLGIVPEVQTGFPEWLPYGASKKHVWRVSGSASCIHNGEIVTVLCDESTGGIDNRISLPGYESDNVAGVAAKARRRLLQMLWSKLSPILNEPQADDETEQVEAEVQHVEMKKAGTMRVEHKQTGEGLPASGAEVADEIPERERQKLAFAATYDAIQRRVKDQTQLDKINDAWHALTIATDKQTLREFYETLGDWKKEIGENNVRELRRYCTWCAEGIAE